MKSKKFISLLLLFYLFLYSEYKERVLVEGSWKTDYYGPGEFGFSGESPPFGPKEFTIDPITKDIYIRDAFWSRIQVFDSSGKFLKTLPLQRQPKGIIELIRFDKDGYIYTSEYGAAVGVDEKIYRWRWVEVGLIRKYDRNWNLLAEWSGEDKNSPLYPKIYAKEKIGEREFIYYPSQILNLEIGKSGNIYIRSGWVNLVLNEKGKLLYWSKDEYIIEDPLGNIYIHDCTPKKKPTLAYLGKMEKGKFPRSKIWVKEFAHTPLRIDKEGMIYIFDGDRKVKKLDKELNLVCEIEVKPTQIVGCEVWEPVVDDEGNIYQTFSKNKGFEKEHREFLEECLKDEPPDDPWRKYFENVKYLSSEEKRFYGFRIYKWEKK